MADICPFCLSPNAENLDSMVVHASAGFPSALVPLIQAAVIPLQQSHQEAVDRGARLTEAVLPPILAARLKLFACPQCRLRYRIAHVPIDVLYKNAYLRSGGQYRYTIR